MSFLENAIRLLGCFSYRNLKLKSSFKFETDITNKKSGYEDRKREEKF